MNTRNKVLLSVLVVILGTGLTGIILWGFAGPAEDTPPIWPLEGDKPGQSSLWGSKPDSGFGRSMAVGDVNGDGFDDLIASAPYAWGESPTTSAVYVMPGPLSFHDTYTMPQPAALVFQGAPGSQTQLGAYLASGDLNGDGYDDLVMGGWTPADSYVYLGSAAIQSGSPITIAAASENMALTVSPAEGATVCDLNGDGYQDLFFEHLSMNGGLEVKVWGVLGSSALTNTNPLTLTMPADADVTIEGFHPDSWNSPDRKNLACGDIDGDGVQDLAIGIFGESPAGRLDAGSVYVVPGDPDFTPGTPVTLTMPDQAGAIIDGKDGQLVSGGDALGTSLASADVDRDGRSDLIIGAPGAAGPDNLLDHAGEVYLWLGRALEGQRFTITDQSRWTVYGEAPLDGLGGALATGDFNRDGYPEVLLGCRSCLSEGVPVYPAGDDGQMENLYGSGYVLAPLQIAGSLAVTEASQLELQPYEGARCLGETVDAMDLDGDKTTDLLISAPCTDYPQRFLPGTVYAVSYLSQHRLYVPVVRK